MTTWEFGLIALAAGVLCVLGALRRWRWLVDPPTFLWFCYSQSLIKAIAGAEGCRIYTLVLGELFILVGLLMLSQPLLTFVHGP
jgi:hypothetical protein